MRESDQTNADIATIPQRHATGYFKKKSNSVNQAGIKVPTNRSNDNLFTRNLDVLEEQEFENELEVEPRKAD